MKISELLKARWVAWVWKHTPNYTDRSRLASRSFEQSLPLGTRLKMRLHYLICVWCKRYFKQLKFLHDAAARFGKHTETLPAADCPPNPDNASRSRGTLDREFFKRFAGEPVLP